MSKFYIGDRVKIKTWEAMEKEFGLNYCQTINCIFGFTKEMKHLCEEEGIITEINSDLIRIKFDNDINNHYSISEDMIIKIENEKEKMKIGDLVLVKPLSQLIDEFKINCGDIETPSVNFVKSMRQHCGNVLRIKYIDKLGYYLEDLNNNDCYEYVFPKQSLILIKEYNIKLIFDFNTKYNYIVEYNDCRRRLVINDIITGEGFGKLSSYSNDLFNDVTSDLDINKIYILTKNSFFETMFEDKMLKLIWDRNEKNEETIDWSEVEVDTPIFVSDDGKDYFKRHFCKYEYNTVHAFEDGKTKFSSNGRSCSWKYAKLI